MAKAARKQKTYPHQLDTILTDSLPTQSSVITTQEALQKAKVESERQKKLYEAVTSSTPDLIYVFDLEYKFTYANEALLKMWGKKTLKDAYGKRLRELGYEKWHADMHEREIDYIIATKESVRGQVAFPHATLGKRIYDYILNPIINSKGEVEAVSGTTRDITELKQNEERQMFLEKISATLVTSFDNFVTLKDIGKLIVSHIADYCRIAIIDYNNQITEISVNHKDPTQVALAEDLYENYKDRSDSTHGIPQLLKIGKSELIEKIDKNILATAKNNPRLIKLLKKIGLKSYMGVPLIARGKVIGAITFSSVSDNRHYTTNDLKFAEEIAHRIALALDNVRLYHEAQDEIRERKQAELNLHYLADASRILASSLDYKTTLSNIAKAAVPEVADWCGVDLLDKDGNLEQVAVAHKDPKKVRWAKELRKINPPDMNSKSGMPNVIRTGKTEFYQDITDEMLIKLAKNKKQLQLMREIGFTSAIVAPLCLEEKCIGGITFVRAETKRQFTHADLTMVEELANRASLALENAGLYKASQDAVALRDDFISVASHELKTPITSVKIFTEVLQQHSKQIGDVKAVNHLTKMNKQLDKLTELIYNMLNISKIQAGRLEFNEKKFDFDTFVIELVDVLQAGSLNHTLQIKGKTNKKIYGDEDRISQVLSNLVSNAIKYSPKSNKVVIHLSATAEDVVVCVEDFGIGLAQEHTEKIFERFYRVFDETDKTFPGLGIGLYISSEIIKRHHGKVWVKSKMGKGSKFYFSLPLKRSKKPNGVQVL
jgi:PAS domain S-box-containing protein